MAIRDEVRLFRLGYHIKHVIALFMNQSFANSVYVNRPEEADVDGVKTTCYEFTTN